MRFSYWASTGQTWQQILNGAKHAEATGWHGLWIPDHFMPPADGYGPEDHADANTEMGPILEAWTVLAGLAHAVPRVRLGTMVSANTYRHPAVLANMAATVDHIAGGRFVVGLGAGWQENEHDHYGLDLGTLAERSDRFEEACEVLKMLFSQDRTSFDGRYYQLDDAPMEPKPIQQPLPLMIGGGGEKRTLRTVARFADEWNVWGHPHELRQKIGVLERHCRDVGRDVGEIEKAAVGLLIFTDTKAETAELRAGFGSRGGLVGTPTELRAAVAEYRDAGVNEIIVPDFAMPVAERRNILDRFRAEVIDA
ncbi:MAG: TIGR03560 family F420-dependent LLM class oxidoreductase [Acidimicrobiaceae bacterium]|jgi:F420-dependent oxidoreductase-like protein|nr:TIGR03560 family F420-dependent LLM class oxidoreductase [Acidimicrobiaceae bacterium]MBT5580800.1 TIGR03560 family F420-dependent LLM class oxidoreductase [Acidimicrobiaceae bacterium]MBT5849661.1 TIGR03560 family F420-dependent LLM class oxidoreductase [Acidimicrobiaceae bacterium]